jgi:hypothetical protein
MKTKRAIFLTGVCGMACSVVLYVALLAVWPSLPLTRSFWLLPLYGRPEMLAAWIIGTLVVVGAWLFGRRLALAPAVVVATVLIVTPAVWLFVDNCLVRAFVDPWPTFGSEAWRTYLAPFYAEYSITAFLGFASIAALAAARPNHRNQSAED